MIKGLSGIVALFASVFCLCARAEPSFSAAPEFPTNAEPWGVVVGDFDNDGYPDVAMANFDSPGTATVLAGNGQGSFAYRSASVVNKLPQGIAAADFDGDGRLDLVVSSISNDASDIVSVLLGNGDGTFAQAVEYPVGATPFAVVAVDLNGDGKPDIVAANANDNSLSVLVGLGDGTFADRVDYDLGASPLGLAIGDIDGDGLNDLVASLNAYLGSFAVLYGQADGTLSAPVYAGPGGQLVFDVALADLDRDGHLDVVLLDRPASKLDAYFARGDGTYANVIEIPTDADVSSVAAGNLFNDGHIELISSGGSGARLFEARDDRTFHDAGALPGFVGGADIAITDLDGDGMPDIVAPSYSRLSSTALINQTLLRAGFE